MARTIAERFDPRDNGLNLLRLALASAIVFWHVAPLTGSDYRGFYLGDMGLGQFAVSGFFAISGYLIVSSRLTTTMSRFAWRRFLRIYPGYWVVLIFVAYGAAPIAGRVRGGWSASSAAGYIHNNFTLFVSQWSVGDTLKGAYPAWNGSLWTLSLEVMCYALIGIVLPRFARDRVVPICSTFFGISMVLAIWQHAGVLTLPHQFGLSLLPVPMTFFAAGALLRSLHEHLPLHAPLAAIAAFVFLAGASLHVSAYTAPLPVAYLCLWLGVALPPRLRSIGRTRDLSYGLYLYAFPVGQLLYLAHLRALGVYAFAALNIVAALCAAFLSWTFVESRSIAFGRWALRRADALRAPIVAEG